MWLPASRPTNLQSNVKLNVSQTLPASRPEAEEFPLAALNWRGSLFAAGFILTLCCLRFPCPGVDKCKSACVLWLTVRSILEPSWRDVCKRPRITAPSCPDTNRSQTGREASAGKSPSRRNPEDLRCITSRLCGPTSQRNAFPHTQGDHKLESCTTSGPTHAGEAEGTIGYQERIKLAQIRLHLLLLQFALFLSVCFAARIASSLQYQVKHKDCRLISWSGFLLSLCQARGIFCAAFHHCAAAQAQLPAARLLGRKAALYTPVTQHPRTMQRVQNDVGEMTCNISARRLLLEQNLQWDVTPNNERKGTQLVCA